MKTGLAILITLGLLVGCRIVSALIYFDLSWILIGITSVWAAIDSSKIGLNRYKLGIACRPIVLFCLCYLLWILIFPYYLWARFKIKDGTAILKSEALETTGSFKRFFRRLSQVIQPVAEWGLIIMVGLKIAILLFCIEECWRGQRVWDNYRHELEARGEIFDWDAMIPPPVPDAQNFFSAPMMSAWFIKPSGKISITDDLATRLNYTNRLAPVEIVELTLGQPGDKSSSIGDVHLLFSDPRSPQRAKELIQNLVGSNMLGARGVDMLAGRPLNTKQIKPVRIFLETDKTPTIRNLIEFFGDHNNSTSGPLTFKPAGTNSFRVLASFCVASDYLKWSDQFVGDFSLLREAIKRPYARMDGDYSYPPTIPIPNFVAVRAIAQTLAQRAQCYLLLGDPEKALKELTLLNDLRRMLEGAPTGKPMTLVAAMINVAVTELYVNVIADGFRLHEWTEPQLVALQKQLGLINLAPVVQEALREEQASAWRILQTVVTNQFETPHDPNTTLWQKVKNLRPPNILRGFIALNMVNVAKLDQMVIQSIVPDKKIVLVEKMANFQEAQDKLGRHFSPYTLFAVIAVPNFTKAGQKFAYVQTKTDEAQIACALERYRLIHNRYPETLNELVPQFIEKLPHDIIGSAPLKYRHSSDARFILYSVGWNKTDDGGQLNSASHDKGDWIWE